MNFDKILLNYDKLSHSSDFIEFQKKLIDKYYSALTRGYFEQKKEYEIVEDIVNTINSIEKNKYINIKGNFIHGNKSQVTFKYESHQTQRELGDLITIISIYYEGEPVTDKLSIIQVKKDSESNERWRINQEQLYLLSNFPTLKGVSGIVPKKEIYLENSSKTLGTYHLYQHPGEQIYLSAPLLNFVIGDKRSITKTKLQEQMSHIKMDNIFHQYCLPPIFYYSYRYWHNISVFKTIHYANNVHDYIYNWIRFNIGEIVFSKFKQLSVNENVIQLYSEINKQIHRYETLLAEYKINTKKPFNPIDYNLPDIGTFGYVKMDINVPGDIDTERNYNEY